jgi:hypothetical protein
MPRRQFRQGEMSAHGGVWWFHNSQKGKLIAADALGELRSFEPETEMNVPGEMVYFVIPPRMHWRDD